MFGIQSRIWIAGTHRWQPDPGAQRFAAWAKMTGEVLASHRTGESLLIRSPGEDFEGPVVRKRFRYPTARDRWRGAFRNTFLAPSRVQREAHNLRRLAEAGLNPDLALATAERRRTGVLHEALLFTRYVPSEPLARLFGPGRDRNCEHLLRELGAFLGRLHRAGFVDRDFHLRNVLRTETGRLIKIDCPRGAFVCRALRRRAQERDRRDLARDLHVALGEPWPAPLQRAYRDSLHA